MVEPLFVLTTAKGHKGCSEAQGTSMGPLVTHEIMSGKHTETSRGAAKTSVNIMRKKIRG